MHVCIVRVRRLQCEVSADSIMDYGHNVLLSTGNFLCSAPSVNSTMDFSKKLVDDGVVDSPLEKKVQLSDLDRPSTLRATEVEAPTMSLLTIVRLMQKKVYGDANYDKVLPKVPDYLRDDNHEILRNAAKSTSAQQDIKPFLHCNI
uniref:Uncharacterized protein n=1 Tax=Physcomitrium patens TaxID=3218 RepID=A0A7I4CWF0_PHYPA